MPGVPTASTPLLTTTTENWPRLSLAEAALVEVTATEPVTAVPWESPVVSTRTLTVSEVPPAKVFSVHVRTPGEDTVHPLVPEAVMAAVSNVGGVPPSLMVT